MEKDCNRKNKKGGEKKEKTSPSKGNRQKSEK